MSSIKDVSTIRLVGKDTSKVFRIKFQFAKYVSPKFSKSQSTKIIEQQLNFVIR